MNVLRRIWTPTLKDMLRYGQVLNDQPPPPSPAWLRYLRDLMAAPGRPFPIPEMLRDARGMLALGGGLSITTANLETAGISGSGGIVLTAGSPADTKGSYTQLIASTAFAAKGLLVVIGSMSNAQQYLTDIATGAATSEVVLIANIATAAFDVGGEGLAFYCPIKIASVTRLSGRTQCSLATAECQISAILIGQEPTATSVATYGAVSSGSRGTQITPDATANTEGTYAQLTASTSAALQWLLVLIPSRGTYTVDTSYVVDIATGAATSESVLVSDLNVLGQAVRDEVLPRVFGPIPVFVASGTRLATRCKANRASAQALDVVVYAMTM